MSQGAPAGLAIALVLVANLLFSFVDTSVKWLIGAGLLTAQLAFMRYAVHFGITVAEKVFRRRPPKPLARGVRGLIVLRAFCLVSATLANFVALGRLPLAVTSALLYLSPLFICLFARLILGERIRPYHLVSIALGLAGAVIILWPFGKPINWFAVLMLYPATGMALYQVLSRKLAGAAPAGTLQFYTGAFGTVALAPFALFGWSAPGSSLEWGLLIAIGLFAWAGHEALTRAHAFAAASDLAPFGYSFILFLTLAGFAVFDQLPTTEVWIGIAFIVASGLLSWQKQRAL